MGRSVNEMLTRLGYELKDPEHTNFTEPELMEYINQAVRAVMQRIAATWPEAWLLTGEDYVDVQNVTNGTANYNLPENFYQLINPVASVKFTGSDGESAWLEPVSLERSIDNDEDNGYMLINNDVYLYPTPDASVTNGLSVYFISIPDDVTDGSDSVPLSTYFEDAIDGHVLIKCKARQEESNPDFTAFYKMTRDALDMLVAKTNQHEDAGLHVAWRNWI